MIDGGKHNLLGVLIDVVDYEAATSHVIEAAKESRPFASSALAVHGVMTGFQDRQHQYRLNRLQLVVPDGQPGFGLWALQLDLPHRSVRSSHRPEPHPGSLPCPAEARLPIYLYGSKPDVLKQLSKNLVKRFPNSRSQAPNPHCFVPPALIEKRRIIDQIRDGGGPKITFVGLGCPRQEVWAYEYCRELSMPVLAVGAAFDFHAGKLARAPSFLQRQRPRMGLPALHEPRRLWSDT